MRGTIRRAKRSALKEYLLLMKLKADGTSNFRLHKDAIYLGGKIIIGKNSNLSIGKDTIINGDLLIGDSCNVTIGKGCSLDKVRLNVSNSSSVSIEDGVIFEGISRDPLDVNINCGTFIVKEKAKIQAEIMVRFGGSLVIGRYTGIGYGSEIRCEEKVDIGEYGLISYGVAIYDTNTHSTDWKQRRERITNGYPYGCDEIERPKTKPVLIGDDVWIGKGATVLKGSVIGDRCILGIGTIVSDDAIKDDSTVVLPKSRIISQEIDFD